MAPSTDRQYDEFLAKMRIRYQKEFVKFPYEDYGLNIETTPSWINIILTKTSYSLEDKETFLIDFFQKYISDEEFFNLMSEEQYAIVFVKFEETISYVGYFTDREASDYENTEGEILIIHQIPMNDGSRKCYDYMDVLYSKKEATIRLIENKKSKYKSIGPTSNNFEIQTLKGEVTLKTCNDLNYKTVKMLIDTGCSVTNLPCYDFWDSENSTFKLEMANIYFGDLSKNELDQKINFLQYLKNIIKNVHYMSVKGNTGKSEKEVIVFSENLRLYMGKIFILENRFSIPHENCETLLLGMNSISKCNIFSFIENDKQYLHIEPRSKNKIYFRNKKFEKGIILSSVFNFSKDVYLIDSKQENAHWYKTTNSLNVLEVESTTLRVFFKIRFSDLENNQIYVQDKYERLHIILSEFDGIIINSGDMYQLILSKKL